jgi:hypothetical protein
MLVRGYIYCHLVAALLSAPAEYLDGKSGIFGYLSVVAIGTLLFFPVALIVILCLRRVSTRDKVFALIVGVAATICQFVALIPLIQ